MILGPLNGQNLKVYLIGAVLATIFEYIVGRGMIKFLGELWWDYNEKPLNFQGIICLESTVAWGFYAIGVVHFVHAAILGLVDMVDMRVGTVLICLILFGVAIDYTVQLLKVFQVDVKGKRDRIVERCHSFIARWY